MNQTSLGKRIRQERKKSNLTQEQLAELVNVSATYIGFIERGERTLSLSTLVHIANVLGVSVDYLLCDSVTPEASSQELLLLKLFSSATPKERETILELVKVLLRHP